MKRRTAMTTIAAGAALLKMKNPVWGLVGAEGQSTLYVTLINLSKEIFCDSIERVVFVTSDLRLFIFNSGENERIAGPESRISEYLVEQGVEIDEIVLIIHNHFTPRRFTERNNKTYYYFKNKGFRGFFAIYYPATGKVRVKKDE